MQSQIEYELDVLKSGNYDRALQFIEHLVNILVRMANALTVPEKEPNAHKKLWKRFTDDLLVYLTQVNPDILYVMWGGNAKEHGQRIEQELNCNDNILYSSHPSPLSARHSFFGSKPFSWVNYQLRCQRKAPIDWT